MNTITSPMLNISGQTMTTVDSNKPNTIEMLNRSFVPFPILTTERLTLRQLVMNDDQEIFTLRSDREINKYLGRQLSNTIDDARDFINKI